jgi:hypothetical protein
MKLKLKPKDDAYVLRVKQSQSGLGEDLRRYLLPLPEDFPLLSTHYDGEWFQRVDGISVNQRWKDSDGIDHHRLIFYPAPAMQEKLNAMENDWRIRNDYLLLLWKMLQKFGVANYRGVPSDVHYSDFDRYLNASPKMKLKLKPNGKLKLKLKEVA